MASLLEALRFDDPNYTGAGLRAPAPSTAMPTTLRYDSPAATGLTNPAQNPGTAGLGTGLGMNIGTAQLGLAGIGTLGNLWGAFQAQNLAKKQFNLSSRMAETNLTNQLQSYNTNLTDRITSRGKAQGMSDSEVSDYLDKNRLTR